MNLETRVTLLEHDMEQLRQLPELFHDMDKKIDRLLENKPCPAPGLCVRLDERVSSLEHTRSETKGGWKTLTIIGSLSSVIGGAVGWVINHFSNTKHP